jgi:multiple RNA-binding domain-containing protein 1
MCHLKLLIKICASYLGKKYQHSFVLREINCLIYSTYGQLKSLRMPKKFNGGHRGFAFLDFLTKQEAKNVYNNMGNIHLYGRHLVLEWAQEDDNVESLREKTGKHYSKEENIGGRVNKRQKVDLDGDEDMLE